MLKIVKKQFWTLLCLHAGCMRREDIKVEHRQLPLENDVVLVYEVMEKSLHLDFGEANYDGKVFISEMNTDNGKVDGQTVFHYHQDGYILWAEYDGGAIVKEILLGTVSTQGELDFIIII